MADRPQRAPLASFVVVIVLTALALVGVNDRIFAHWPPPLWPYSRELPFVSEVFPGAPGWWRMIVGCEVCWSLAYLGIVLTLAGRAASSRRLFLPIVLMQSILLAIVLFAPIPFNSDQYLYVAFGDLTLSGSNPYDPPLKTAPVSQQLREISTVWGIVDEGASDATARIVERDRYGPSWTLATAGILSPFHALNAAAKARVLRVVSALALLACSVLLWYALVDVPWRNAALAAFALNPLFITQTALGGHNDSIAVAFGIASYLAAQRRHLLVAGVAAGLSLGTKLSLAPYLLALVVYGWRWRLRGAGTVVLASAAVLLVSALPFGGVRALVQPVVDAGKYNTPYIVALAQDGLPRHLPGLQWLPLYHLYVGLTVLTALALGVAVLRRRRVPAVELALALLIFSAARFEPWYALMLTPLLLVPRTWALGTFLGLTLAAQVLEQKNFIGGYTALPILPFTVGAAVLVVTAIVALRAIADGDSRFSPPRALRVLTGLE